ncbi:hypothetical protein Trydic_g2866 [Trypoxylus dichotomus]
MFNLRPILLRTIPILITVVNCVSNHETLQPREFAYLVRICVKSQTKGEYIACLGTYNHIQQILAGKECLEHMDNSTVELWMGSRKMDCRSGQKRFLWKYHVTPTHLIIQPFASFHLSAKVSAIDQFRRFTLYRPKFLYNCWIFCNRKYLKGNDLVNSAICDERVGAQKLWPIPCPREYAYNKVVSFIGNNQSHRVLSHNKSLLEDNRSSLLIAVQGNGRPNRCGTIHGYRFHSSSKNTFYPSLSPVVCDGVLYGFVNVNQSDFSRISYQPIPVVDNSQLRKIRRRRKKVGIEAKNETTTTKHSFLGVGFGK